MASLGDNNNMTVQLGKLMLCVILSVWRNVNINEQIVCGELRPDLVDSDSGPADCLRVLAVPSQWHNLSLTALVEVE